jgi:hypothetical protein
MKMNLIIEASRLQKLAGILKPSTIFVWSTGEAAPS